MGVAEVTAEFARGFTAGMIAVIAFLVLGVVAAEWGRE